MMRFDELYKNKQVASGQAVVGGLFNLELKPGSYSDGIKILSLEQANDLQICWSSSIGSDAKVFLATSVGDFFFWKSGEIYYFEIQDGVSASITNDIDLFWNGFMTNDNIRESVLKVGLFEVLKDRLGDLSTNECFGVSPVMSLGGLWVESNFSKSDLYIYNDLVKQSLR